MNTDVFQSVLAKISLVAPLAAKSAIDVAMKKKGYSVENMTPSEFLDLINENINPGLRQYLKMTDSVLNAGAGLLITDAEDRILFMNAVLRSLIATYGRITKIESPQPSEVLQKLGFMLPTSKIQDVCVREFHSADLKRDYNVAVTPVRDDGGRVLATCCIIQDVTLKKAVEQDVRDTERKMSYLLNNMRQAVFTVNSEGIIVGPASRFSEQIFGQAIIGQPALNTVFKDVDRKCEEFSLLQTAFNTIFGESELQFELMDSNLLKKVQYWRGVRKSIPADQFDLSYAQARILSIDYNPIWDSNGQLERLMFLVTDVTQIEKLTLQIEKEKQENLERIRMIEAIARTPASELRAFLSKAVKDLASLENDVLAINLRPQLLGQIFRTLHTLKGNARALSFPAISRTTHEAEYFLAGMVDAVSKSEKVTEQHLWSFIQSIQDMLSSIGDHAKAAKQILAINTGVDSLLLAGFRDRLKDVGNALAAIKSPPFEKTDENLRLISQLVALKARAKHLDERELTQACERLKEAYFSEEGEGRDSEITTAATELTRICDTLLERAVDSEEESDYTPQNRTVEIPYANFQRLKGVIERGDRFIATESRTVLQIFNKLLDIPVTAMLDRLSFTVAELAERFKKEVNLDIHCPEDTTVSQTQLDMARDALIHLIRNAVDHGIETPEIRRSIGKPQCGTVRIKVVERPDKILFEVKDDGAGISVDKVVSSTLKQGLLTEARVSSMTFKEKLNLIFQPQVSTKTEINEISGRGIGLDAVKSQIEKAGGAIEVESEAGKGTTFRFFLPLDPWHAT